MRSINDIINDVNAATDRSDTRRMLELADEASAHQSYSGQQLYAITSARAYLIRGDVDSANSYLKTSLELALNAGNASDEAKALSGIASLFMSKGEFNTALEYHRRALDAFMRGNDGSSGAANYYNIALVLLELGQLEEALINVRKAIELHGSHARAGSQARAYGLLASILAQGGATDEALVWFYKALDHLGAEDDPRGRAQVIGNIATIYYDLERYDDCIPLYKEAIQILELGGYNDSLTLMHDNLSSAYRNVADYKSASQHLDRSLEISTSIGNKPGLSMALSKKVSLLVHQHNLSEARDLFDTSHELHTLSTQHYLRWVLVESELLAQEGHTEAAYVKLLNVVPETVSSNSAALQAEYHVALRDLAFRRSDLHSYVKHNDAYAKVTEEYLGKRAIQRITTLEANRKIEAELRERDKERALLYGALPKSVADRMIRGEDVSGDHYDNAAVMFIDIVDFTSNTSHLPPSDVVKMLENIFSTIDSICEQHNVIKIKTIGDSYMCFAHDGNGESGIGNSIEQRMTAVALAIQQAEFYWPPKNLHEDLHEDLLERLTFRIGIHRGPVTAGVIGTQRLQYDVWGDTVNVASRMESTSEPGRIHVSEAFASFLGLRPRNDSSHLATSNQDAVIPNEVRNEEPGTWHLALRGETELKGKGLMTTYWLEGPA